MNHEEHRAAWHRAAQHLAAQHEQAAALHRRLAREGLGDSSYHEHRAQVHAAAAAQRRAARYLEHEVTAEAL